MRPSMALLAPAGSDRVLGLTPHSVVRYYSQGRSSAQGGQVLRPEHIQPKTTQQHTENRLQNCYGRSHLRPLPRPPPNLQPLHLAGRRTGKGLRQFEGGAGLGETSDHR